MGMSGSLELAKEWAPKSEWEDLRCYVLKSDYEQLQAKLDEAVKALEWIAAKSFGDIKLEASKALKRYRGEE
jgi:hypothetical protein